LAGLCNVQVLYQEPHEAYGALLQYHPSLQLRIEPE
jgi:hypothetical protein